METEQKSDSFGTIAGKVIFGAIIIGLLIGWGYVLEHWPSIKPVIVSAAVFIWERTTLLTWTVAIGIVFILESLSTINMNLRLLIAEVKQVREESRELLEPISAEAEERERDRLS